jgi:hypothetical protein
VSTVPTGSGAGTHRSSDDLRERDVTGWLKSTGVDVRATPVQLDTGVSTAAAAVATAIGLEEAFADGSLGVAWSALPDPEQEHLAGLLTAGKQGAARRVGGPYGRCICP